MQTSSLVKQTAQPTWKTLVPASMVSHLVRDRNHETNLQPFPRFAHTAYGPAVELPAGYPPVAYNRPSMFTDRSPASEICKIVP
jgi:hypothetical protein